MKAMKELEKAFFIAPEDTAVVMGSGDLPVLSTPRAIAMAENVSMLLAKEITEVGETTVGTRIDFYHTKASKVGTSIKVVSRLVAMEGKALNFECRLVQGEETVAHGTHVRYVVNEERFMSKLE